MQFSSEDYFRAAIQRLNRARTIHEATEDYAFSMYSSGLAVECMLRAFRWEKQQDFDGRHDIEKLLSASDLLRIIEKRKKATVLKVPASDDVQKIQVAINEVAILWHNNHRFASESRLEAFLKKIKRWEGIKGDAKKKNSSDLLEAATKIIEVGIILWKSAKKSTKL